jgi:Flp pilus assembly protein TadG
MKPRTCRHPRGVAIVWVAITLVVLLGLIGLALDTARVLLVAHELQNAADAAALAGAQWVRSDALEARSAARSTAAANDAEGVSITLPDNPSNDPNGKIVIGIFDRTTQIFTATTSAPNAVKVIAGRTSGQNGSLPLIFGPIFNVSTSDITRQAIAMVGGGTGAGLIALSSTGPGLSTNGTVNLTVDDGVVVVDAASNPISTAGASGIITAEGIKIVAPSTTLGPPNYTGAIYPESNYVPDPLSSMPAPNYATMTKPNGTSEVSVKNNDLITLNPGYYPGGLQMTGGSLTLRPGVYVFDNEVKINGGAFVGNDVMIYVRTGQLTLGGNGTIQITPLSTTTDTTPADAVYDKMAIWVADNDPKNAPSIGGNNGTVSIGGTIYVPNNTLSLQGTGDLTAGNQLIANKVSVGGNGTITIHYDGRNPAAGNRVYIVK